MLQAQISFFFDSQPEKIYTGRIFYKIAVSGNFNYSLFFSNTIDSTYSDGSISHRNLICDSWIIHSVRIGKLIKDSIPEEFTSISTAEKINSCVTDFIQLSFNGAASKW